MRDGWADAYLGVGSSLDPERNIRLALSGLKASPHVEVKAISTFYRTAPLPAPGQDPSSVVGDPDFLNGVFSIRTKLSLRNLTNLLADLEDAAGRVRTDDPYAPRALDLDILLHLFPAGDADREDPPSPVHKDVRERPWVAYPLFELSPRLLLHPEGTPLAEVVRGFSGPGGVRDELTEFLRQDLL